MILILIPTSLFERCGDVAKGQLPCSDSQYTTVSSPCLSQTLATWRGWAPPGQGSPAPAACGVPVRGCGTSSSRPNRWAWSFEGGSTHTQAKAPATAGCFDQLASLTPQQEREKTLFEVSARHCFTQVHGIRASEQRTGADRAHGGMTDGSYRCLFRLQRRPTVPIIGGKGVAAGLGAVFDFYTDKRPS